MATTEPAKEVPSSRPGYQEFLADQQKKDSSPVGAIVGGVVGAIAIAAAAAFVVQRRKGQQGGAGAHPDAVSNESATTNVGVL